MRVIEVERIIQKYHPEVKDWAGKNAELVALAYLCNSEDDVLARLQDKSKEYQELLWSIKEILESHDDPEKLIEFVVSMWSKQRTDSSIEEPGLVTQYIQENISQFNRAQIRALANFTNLAEMQKFLESEDFKNLTYSEDDYEAWLAKTRYNLSGDVEDRVRSLGLKVHKGITHNEGIQSLLTEEPDASALISTLLKAQELQGVKERARKIALEIVREKEITDIATFRRVILFYSDIDFQKELVEAYREILSEHDKKELDAEIQSDHKI